MRAVAITFHRRKTKYGYETDITAGTTDSDDRYFSLSLSFFLLTLLLKRRISRRYDLVGECFFFYLRPHTSNDDITSRILRILYVRIFVGPVCDT